MLGSKYSVETLSFLVQKHHAYAGRAENKSALADIIAALEWASSKHAREVVACGGDDVSPS